MSSGWGNWERQSVDPDGTVSWGEWSKVRKAGSDDQKKARQRFARLMATEEMHVRIGDRRHDGTRLTLIGHARDLHGSVCTCCPRRAA